jgi:hypothetical protein
MLGRFLQKSSKLLARLFPSSKANQAQRLGIEYLLDRAGIRIGFLSSLKKDYRIFIIFKLEETPRDEECKRSKVEIRFEFETSLPTIRRPIVSSSLVIVARSLRIEIGGGNTLGGIPLHETSKISLSLPIAVERQKRSSHQPQGLSVSRLFLENIDPLKVGFVPLTIAQSLFASIKMGFDAIPSAGHEGQQEGK